MKKLFKHKTRTALAMSITSLVLCVAMLAGATFAWFTDTVAGGINNIVSGVLDVELYRGTDTTDPTKKIGPSTELFKNTLGNYLLWEPEAMTAETFTVVNAGTLVLQYKLALNKIANNTVNGANSLLDVITVRILDENTAVTRDNIKAAASMTLGDYLTSSETGVLNPGQSKTFTIALYWPQSENDNIYNLKNGLTANDGSNRLYVDLGINLLATQKDSEADGFGTTYDQLAEYPAAPITVSTTQAVNVNANNEVPANTTIGNITTDAAAATVTAATQVYSDTTGTNPIADPTSLTLEVEPTDSTAAQFTVAGSSVDYYDISLIATSAAGTTEVKKSDKVIKVELKIGTGLNNVAVKHDGTAMTAATSGAADTFTYDATSGILTLYVDSFSPFAIGYDGPGAVIGDAKYADLAAAVAAAKSGQTIKLLKDAKLVAIDNDFNITFDGNNKVIDTVDVAKWSGAASAIKNVTFKNAVFTSTSEDAWYGPILTTTSILTDVTFKNCTFSTKGTAKSNAIYNATVNGTVTFDHCTIYADVYGINFGHVNGELKLLNCEITGWNSFGGAATGTSTVTIDKSNFHKSSYNKLRFYQDAVVTDCKFDSRFLAEDMQGEIYVFGEFEAGIDVNTAGPTVTLNGCKVVDGATESNLTNAYIYTCEDNSNTKFTGVTWKIDDDAVTPRDEVAVPTA